MALSDQHGRLIDGYDEVRLPPNEKLMTNFDIDVASIAFVSPYL